MSAAERSATELLSDLDAQQREVATAVHGPVCVRAGAGTGKTRAITYRIAYAVKTGAHNPRQILAVTFTARAAGEMRSRLRDLGVAQVQARTFHSAALRQLRYFWPQVIGGPVPEIKETKRGLIAQAATQLGMETDPVTIRDLQNEVEWAKVSLITAADYPKRAVESGRDAVGNYSHQEVAQLLQAYEEVKSERGVIDFEDVILILIGIFVQYPNLLGEVRRQYRYFVVDEYQDVSPMQHRLLQLWLGDRRELCVVGDVAQTIYSFAGAQADYLINFAKQFSGAKEVALITDYRSTGPIVQLANELVAEELPGAVRLQAVQSDGDPVSFDCYADDATQASEIAGKILTLRKQGEQLSNMAILYRTRSQSAEFENALAQAGIPFLVQGGERFFARREVKEAMVTLRALARSGPVGELPELVDGVLYTMGWREHPPSAQGAARERWDSWETIRALAAELWETRRATAGDFIAELETRAEHQYEPTQEAVTLSTLHAAKGLEWGTVFLAGMSEGLLPISLARGEALAEEKRLLYVGVTRAGAQLFVSYAKGNAGRGERKVSRFLADLWPKEESRATASRRRSRAKAKELVTEHPEAVPLFAELKAWRAAKAAQLGKPAYNVIHDVTLQEIAIRRPQDLAELGQIRGIGAHKLTNYGLDILAIVAERPFGG
ncbi:MAG: ATP-dependent DNA helicase UvrD2 [Trueperella sp.]|nr:ATP-dependent DNA helicase UvrD2 [Trueperella sp.]